MAAQRIQALSITDTGRKRSNNQDACAVFHKGNHLLMIVADGVGGNMCGEIASRIAVQTFREQFDKAELPDPEDFLATTSASANRNIRAYIREHPECKGMATTLTAALIRYPELHLLQVGDSRAYLLRENRLRQLTEDHTLVRKMVKEGVLTLEEAKIHPKRHVIINALGISEELRFDYFQIPLRPNDQVLLCSDGLYDEVPEQEIRKHLLASEPKEAIQRLVSAANAAGGKDNISITLAVMGGRKLAGTKRFPASPFHKKTGTGRRPVTWLIVLLSLALLVSGTWLWCRSTESGKKARAYVTSLLGMGDSPQRQGNTVPRANPRGTPHPD